MVTGCFGSMRNDVRISLQHARGGGVTYGSAMSGTSMATPLAVGQVALVRQYFTDGFYPAGAATPAAGFQPSAALVKAAFINAASPLLWPTFDAFFGLPASPKLAYDAQGGFGVPNLVRGLSFATLGPASRAAGQLVSMVLPGIVIPGTGARAVEPQLSTGGVQIYCVDTVVPAGGSGGGGQLPLSATLVWTDPPAAPASVVNLINNLDLQAVPPAGAPIAYGNGATDAATPGQVPDTLNNVEKLVYAAPVSTLAAVGGARVAAPYRIVVRGRAVPQGPQNYALVITGPGVVMAPAGSCGGDPTPPEEAQAEAQAEAGGAAAAAAGAPTGVVAAGAVAGGLIMLAAAAVAAVVAVRRGRAAAAGGASAARLLEETA